ncbi:site-specific integrase [Marinifilum sp. D737]|uniref:site-specific integrase n=1 Tax=Marinifilum sp. D737 TaxID=2969628 RepID=UPI002274E921|nr:site-specific integrase [Marinifilum sp. D737]MCY1634858.1 site-specific integrase [Marinifilum sp. D737]
MATAKLILDTRKAKKDGTFPIKLAISHKSKTSYIRANFAIPEKYWDNGRIKRGCPDIDNIRTANNKLASLLLDADDFIEELEERRRIDIMSVAQVADYIKNGGKQQQSAVNFLEYIEKYVPTIKNNSTKEKYNTTLVKLKDYMGTDLLFFDDITKAWLNRYKEYRLENSSAATTNIDLRNIRAIFNRAIDFDEVIGQEIYPFRKFEFAESKPRNLRLPIEKIRQIRDFQTDNKYIALARDFFMLSFYLIGMNNSDIYDIVSITEGRIEYDRNKTNKSYSVKVEPEAMEIFERRKGENLLLIYQERYANARNLTKQMNKHLKELGKHESINIPDLMMYHARHSWAGIAAKKPIGAGKPLIAQALGHGKTTVTDTYFDYDNELVDDLNRRVLTLL